MQFTYDERKLTEMLVYVADRLMSDKAGGATKINKLLFFADFAHVRRTGSPITGAQYQKLEHGPAPRRLKPIRDSLVARDEAEIVVEDFLGYSVHRLVPKRSADISAFDADELATVDKVISDLDGLNARQVSDLSHDEAGWQMVEFGETIPYEAALVGARQLSTPTTRRLERAVAERRGLLPA